MSATNPAEDTLRLLRSIDASLKQLVAQSRIAQPKPVANEADCRAKYGDPKVPVDPRDWTGPSFKGRTCSECPPEFLDRLAETFDWFASQAEAKNEMTDKGKPIADYKRRDAARARGWAKLIRDGKHTPPAPPSGNGSGQWAGDDDGRF